MVWGSTPRSRLCSTSKNNLCILTLFLRRMLRFVLDRCRGQVDWFGRPNRRGHLAETGEVVVRLLGVLNLGVGVPVGWCVVGAGARINVRDVVRVEPEGGKWAPLNSARICSVNPLLRRRTRARSAQMRAEVAQNSPDCFLRQTSRKVTYQPPSLAPVSVRNPSCAIDERGEEAQAHGGAFRVH